jgi:hypothetical protein
MRCSFWGLDLPRNQGDEADEPHHPSALHRLARTWVLSRIRGLPTPPRRRGIRRSSTAADRHPLSTLSRLGPGLNSPFFRCSAKKDSPARLKNSAASPSWHLRWARRLTPGVLVPSQKWLTSNQSVTCHPRKAGARASFPALGVLDSRFRGCNQIACAHRHDCHPGAGRDP